LFRNLILPVLLQQVDNLPLQKGLNSASFRIVQFLYRAEFCQNPETWDPDGGIPFDQAAEDELFEAIDKPYISGITFSGGDPLFPGNRDEVFRLIKKFTEKFPNKTIWLYTGYNWEDVKDLEGMKLVDVVAEGEFIEELKDNNIHWVGSSNQRVIDVKKSLGDEVILHV
jgi:anaerobic ribonucleoside-triphosphate reductase activating protein